MINRGPLRGREETERIRTLRLAFPEYDFCYWGAALMGSRFEQIIVTPWDHSDSFVENETADKWFRYTLQCRLVPKGQMIFL